MTKVKFILFGLVALAVFSSCFREKHTVRFKNDYTETVFNVWIGNAEIGTVSMGELSAYKPITIGSFTVSGTTSNGKQLNGAGFIKGRGTHRWTVDLDDNGSIALFEE